MLTKVSAPNLKTFVELSHCKAHRIPPHCIIMYTTTLYILSWKGIMLSLSPSFLFLHFPKEREEEGRKQEGAAHKVVQQDFLSKK